MATISFSDIGKWASEAQIDVAEKTAQIARETFTNVIRYSPSKENHSKYSSGRFLMNWHIGNTSPSYSVQGISTQAAKIAEVNNTITDDFFLRNTTAYMTNNVDYAKKIEEDGWRRSGPYAPVAQALAAFNAKYGGGSV